MKFVCSGVIYFHVFGNDLLCCMFEIKIPYFQLHVSTKPSHKFVKTKVGCSVWVALCASIQAKMLSSLLSNPSSNVLPNVQRYEIWLHKQVYVPGDVVQVTNVQQ